MKDRADVARALGVLNPSAGRPTFLQFKLDFDGPFPDDFIDRLKFVTEALGVRVRDVARIKTRRGYHAIVDLGGDGLPAIAIVAVQALLGSDYKRETFNLARSLALPEVPDFWQSRYNILFSEKNLTGETDMTLQGDHIGKSRPQLRVADLNGAQFAVVTIHSVEETTYNKEDRLVLDFVEFPDPNAADGELLAYWPNRTSSRMLVKHFGTNEEKWTGERIVLEVVNSENPDTKKPVQTLWVQNPAKWPATIKAYDAEVAKAKKGAKKTASGGK